MFQHLMLRLGVGVFAYGVSNGLPSVNRLIMRKNVHSDTFIPVMTWRFEGVGSSERGFGGVFESLNWARMTRFDWFKLMGLAED